jgi:3-deoxy-D-manno-octulosonic-acid transferase
LPGDVGPHTFNFQAVCEQAIEAGAAQRADNLDNGLDLALAILHNPTRRRTMGEAGRDFAQTHRGATARTLALLAPLLRNARARKR